MKKVVVTRVENLIKRVKKVLRILEKVRLDMELPGGQERLAPLLQAGIDAELICLDLRSFLVDYHLTAKEELFGEIADLQGYSVEERNGVFCIRMPVLPLKERCRSDCSYVAIPLLYALKKYGITHEIPRFDNAIVTVRHNYPNNLPVRYLRDHDNIEVKKVLDVIALYFLEDDNMAHCDLYYTAKPSDSYFTEIFIAPKPQHQGIIGGFTVGESDEKSEKIGLV